MHPKNFRATVAAQLAEAAEHADAAGDFGAPTRGARALVAAIGNQEATVEDRLAAVREASQADPLATPSVAKALLKVLRTPTEPGRLRLAALTALEQASVRMTEFRPFHADFTDALRTVTASDDQDLYQRAMDILALDQDASAQAVLENGLRHPDEATMPPEIALRMLGYDVHAGHYDLLRELVQQTDQPKLRQLALGLLAADSTAKPTFAAIAADPADDPGARATSAIALQSLAPRDFTRLATKVVADDSDDDAVRATMLTALAHDQSQPPVADGGGRRAPSKVAGVAKKLASAKGTSAQLKAAARNYLALKG